MLDALSGTSGTRSPTSAVSSANLVTLKLGKVTVVWGGASEPQLKVEVMTVLLGQKGVRTIDVSAPRTPVTR